MDLSQLHPGMDPRRLQDCPVCGSVGAMRRFEGQTHVRHLHGAIILVMDLAGFGCEVCHEVLFDRPSTHRFVGAGDQLVLAHRRASKAK